MEKIKYEVMAAVELSHWWYGGMRAISAALLDPVLCGRTGLRILDAGCGTGGNALFLQRYGSVVGIDYSSDAAQLGAASIPGMFARGSVVSLPFANKSFDLVTSFDVLYHRAVSSEADALAEARRVLRPGGLLLIRLPAYEFLRSRHDRQVHTRRRYDASEARRLLSDAGFSVERSSYALSLLFPIPLVMRLLERVTPSQVNDSTMDMPAPLLNAALRLPMALEAAWIRGGGALPFGLSIICLARSGVAAAAAPGKPHQGARFIEPTSSSLAYDNLTHR